MRVVDFLDRPIAFHRPFVTLSGSVTAALFLSQAMYWSKRCKEGADGQNWFYKTQAEWEEETGLSRREQEGARKALRSIGVLVEKREGIPAKLYFRIDYGALEVALNEAFESKQSDCAKLPDSSGVPEHPSMHETAILDCAKQPDSSGANRLSITEITTEITKDPPLPPDGGEQSADAELPCPAGKPVIKKPAIQYQAFADAYNAILGHRLPRCEALSDKRKRAIKTLAGNLRPDRPAIDAFSAYLEDFRDHASGFYFGENDRGWRANFDYLIRVDTLIKAREGALMEGGRS
ncbi:hypothetical protein [Aeromonas enteropelogenes]|uniref:hypothetical protein n=1 Tax=Aeromonas enteropelogenes TaxID=29489 RepID=UPI003BA05305